MILDISFKKITRIFLILFCIQAFVISVFAAELKCAVCGMPLGEYSKNHIILKAKGKEPMHVCSLSCAKKMLKHDPSYVEVLVRDFNHPEKTLSGEAAFFLVRSEKIKNDLGDNVMGPYFGSFSSEAEANAAQKKYGEGNVVKGIQNAIK